MSEEIAASVMARLQSQDKHARLPASAWPRWKMVKETKSTATASLAPLQRDHAGLLTMMTF